MTAPDPSPTITPEALAPGLWGLTGADIAWRGVPVPLRCTVVELPGGDLWLHAPCPVTPELRGWLNSLGRVAHVVLPHAPGLPYLEDWRAAWPALRVWRGSEVKTASWCRHVRPLTLEGAQTETAFLHAASRSVILSRLMMAIDTGPMPPWARPLVWLAGIDDSDGKPPPGLARRLGGRGAVGDLVEQILDWGPERLILTHGRLYTRDASGEIKRGFRRLMRDRLWDRAFDEAGRR